MTKRLELYDWPEKSRDIAESMYRIARRLLVNARLFRAQARTAQAGSYDQGCCQGSAEAARAAARAILSKVREGRDADEFYFRQVVRGAVVRSIQANEGKPTNLAGHMFDLMGVKSTGLDRPEFDEKNDF